MGVPLQGHLGVCRCCGSGALWAWACGSGGSIGGAMGCYGADPAPLLPPGAGIVGVPLRGPVAACGCCGCCGSGGSMGLWTL